MKRYTIKNYKGNLLESLTKFAKSHRGMRIVEAVEDKDGSELKIKTEAVNINQNLNYFSDLIEEWFEENMTEDAFDDRDEWKEQIELLKEPDLDASDENVNQCIADLFSGEILSKADVKAVCKILSDLAKKVKV